MNLYIFKRDTRPKLDPKDYSIENKNGETIYKLPGSINGNQFIIQNLEVWFNKLLRFKFQIFKFFI